MKKNILVIMADFFPTPSSNTHCIMPFLKEMIEQGYKVDILTTNNEIDSKNDELYENIKVIRVDQKRIINSKKWKLKEKNTTGFKNKVIRMLSFFSRACYVLFFNIFGNSEKRYSSWNKKEVYSKAVDMHMQNKYDAIMSISYPYITHDIAYNLKKNSAFKNTKWIIVEFDPFCYNIQQYGSNSFEKYYNIQNEFFKTADKILATQELYEYYEKTPFSCYKNKIDYFNFPNFINDFNYLSELSVLKNKDDINLVYGGALNESVRNPKILLEILNKMNVENIRMNILTGSNLDFVNNQIIKLGNKIKVFNQQTYDVAISTINDANILISLGNTVVFQAPGKTFEYMATGKPIIHFSPIKNDTALKYLQNYPLLLIINEYEDLEPQIKKFETFCINNKNKTLNTQETKKLNEIFSNERILQKFIADLNEIFY